MGRRWRWRIRRIPWRRVRRAALGGNDMDTHRSGSRSRQILLAITSTAFVLSGCASHGPSTKPGPPGAEQRFSSPQAAVDALLAACRADDEARLVAIFGDRVKPFVSTGRSEERRVGKDG